jgi:hypothetical protein
VLYQGKDSARVWAEEGGTFQGTFNRPKTLGTSIFRTKVTFILRRQHSAASRGLALHHKLSSRTRRITHFIDNRIVFAIQFVDLRPMFINLRHYFRHSFIRIRDFGIPQRTFIMFGDFRNGHISQYGPSMLSVVFLHKRCVQCRFGKFNIPFGRYPSINYSDLQNKEYETLLARTEVLCKSFEHLFENYNDENNFMFLDPPYDSEFTDYGYCQFGKKEQEKLAKCFKETKIKCLMIIGKTTFIEELYKGYIVDAYDKKYRFKLYGGRVGEEINTKHLVIKNY